MAITAPVTWENASRHSPCLARWLATARHRQLVFVLAAARVSTNGETAIVSFSQLLQLANLALRNCPYQAWLLFFWWVAKRERRISLEWQSRRDLPQSCCNWNLRLFQNSTVAQTKCRHTVALLCWKRYLRSSFGASALGTETMCCLHELRHSRSATFSFFSRHNVVVRLAESR